MADGKPKSRLGRGLSGLMGGIAAPPPADTADAVFREATPAAPSPVVVVPHGTPLEVAVDLVRPNPHQPRKHFDDVALRELADSILANGVIQPIVVRRKGEGFELIAGERRLRASKLAGLSTIPAIVRDAEASAQAAMALVENIQRQDLNALDRAAGYQSLLTELGLTQADLATRLGEDRSVISNHLRLLELHPAVQELLRAGKLTLGHAKVLAGITSASEQQRLAGLVVKQELTVRNLERAIATAGTPPTPAASAEKPTGAAAHLKDLELTMSKTLGTRVQIRAAAQKGKGKLVLHYSSLDQFDDLLSKLGVKLDE